MIAIHIATDTDNGPTGAARRAAARRIVREVAEELLTRFGSNTSAARGGRYLPYHNQTHGLGDVCRYAVRAALREVAANRLPARSVPVAAIAAIYHDYEIGAGRGEDERRSADAAEVALRDSRWRGVFDEHDVAMARAAILATVPDVSVPGRIGQSLVATGDVAIDRMQLVLADADLASLGLRRGPHRSLLLLAEVQAAQGEVAHPGGPGELGRMTIDAATLEPWLASHVELYRNHRFHLASTRADLAAGQERNAQTAGRLLERVRAGAGFGEVLAVAAGEAQPAA